MKSLSPPCDSSNYRLINLLPQIYIIDRDIYVYLNLDHIYISIHNRDNFPSVNPCIFSVRCEISDRLIVPANSIKPSRNECGNKALFHSFLSANLIMAVELYRFPISGHATHNPLPPVVSPRRGGEKKLAR